MLQTELKQEYRDEQLAKIRQKNNHLCHIVSGEFDVQVLAAVCPQSKAEQQAAAEHTSTYNIIQNQAKLLHILLQQKLKKCTHGCQVNRNLLT